MSEHPAVVAAQQHGERDGETLYLTAIAKEAQRLDAALAELQALVPGTLPYLEIEAKLRTVAGLVNGFEARYPAMLTRWAREQRLELYGEARRLLGVNQRVVTAREWEPIQ